MTKKKEYLFLQIITFIQLFLTVFLYAFIKNIFGIIVNSCSLFITIIMVAIYTVVKRSETVSPTVCLFFINLSILILNKDRSPLFLCVIATNILMNLISFLIQLSIVKSKTAKKNVRKVEKNDNLKPLIEKYKQLTEKQCYGGYIIEGEPGILDDKIGGIPYLPIGESYPLDKSGKEMPLFFQLDLEKIDLPDFPKKGIFELFIANGFDYPTEYTIRYFEKGLEYQKDLVEPDHEDSLYEKAIKLRFEKTITHKPIMEYTADELLYSLIKEFFGKEVNSYLDIDELLVDNPYWLTEISEAIQSPLLTVGGYGDFTQFDPRSKDDERTECLLKIDNMLSMDYLSIGDCGIATVLISKEDLVNGKLENGSFDWDCH